MNCYCTLGRILHIIMSQVTPTSEQNSKNIFQTLLIFRISVKLFEYFFLSRFLHFVPTHECAFT